MHITKSKLITVSKYFILLTLFLNISCSDNKTINDKQKLASLFIELQLSLEKNRGNLQVVTSERKKIFKKYDVSEEQYNRSVESLGQDKEKWEEFFTIVSNKLNSTRPRI